MKASDIIINDGGILYHYDTPEEAQYHVEVKRLLGVEVTYSKQADKPVPARRIKRKRIKFTRSEDEVI